MLPWSAPLFALALALQQPGAGDPLDRIVLRQDGAEHTARQIVARVARWDKSLQPTLEADAEYLRIYLNSPVFLEHVRAYSDALLLDLEQLPEPSQRQIEEEAVAWARDRSLPPDAPAALAKAGIEIETRARMIAAQPDGFGSNELRQHMLRSVPEFFGQLQVAWIRAPLIDVENGQALPEARRRAVYERLDEVARAVQSGELTWDAAVQRCTEDAELRARGGPVGIVERTMTQRYEEELLRPLFADLGFRRPEGASLRGPILTARWAYLVRVEALVVSGVVELERVRPRVERSLREHLLRTHLAELAAGAERKVLLPLPE